MLLIQILVNGVLLGGLYACIAIGFSIVWGVLGVINLAHGSLIILGAYITYTLFSVTGLDPFLLVPVAGLTLFVFGYLLHAFVMNRVVRVSVFLTLIFTFGLDMVLINLNIALFTADIRSITTSYSGLGFDVGGIRIPYVRLAVFTVGLALTAALFVFMTRTRTGNAILATAQNLSAARVMGVNTERIYALTFGIGAAMAGMAGGLMAVTTSFSPVIGASYTMKAFVIVVLGGLGSVPGAIVAGILLGVVENLVSGMWNAGYRDVISFALLVLILVARPRGLMGDRFLEAR